MKLKLIVLFLFLSMTSYSKPVLLKNFNEVLSSLKSGEKVKIVIHYAKCKLNIEGKDTLAPDAIGGMDINAFEYFAPKSVKNDKAFISTSQSVLIYHPKRGHLLNYVKVKLDEDNKINILAQYLDVKTYEVKMNETFISALAESEAGTGGVYFYSDTNK